MKKQKRGLSLFLAFSMMISLFSEPAFADTGSIFASGFNDVTMLCVPKSGSITPVKLDDDVTLTSSVGFADGYLLFKNTGAAVAGDQLSILSDANPYALEAVSLVGSTVYLGNGSTRDVIGSVDGTLNGQNGKDLKILLSAELPNGGFEAGTSNWIQDNSITRLSGDSTTSSTPSTTIEVKARNPYFNWNWVEPIDKSSSYMRLYLSTWINNPYGTLHGPKITSNTFSACKGDHVSLYYYAKNTGDKYDVYGYLTDTATGRKQQLFYERGDETDGWQTVSAEITLPDSDSFVFEFLCGSQDGTGGRYISSELLIDNVRVVSDLVSAQVATKLARRVAMVGASQSTRTSTQDRTYKLTAVDANGNSYTTDTAATIRIHTYPAAPVVIGTPKAGTTDALQFSWSAEGADTYDVWVDADQIFSKTAQTAETLSGLSPNEARGVKVVATNDMGDSNQTGKVVYSAAAAPSLTALSSNTNSVSLGIGNNGNAVGTAYCLERSADGTSWAVVKNFSLLSSTGDTTACVDTGLAANTGYWYRVKARNGDGIQTGYSDSVYYVTAPAAPSPITVTAASGTSDSLDVDWTSSVGTVGYQVYIDTEIADANASGTAGKYGGFDPNTPHDVYVTARSTWGESSASNTVTRYTLANTPEITFGEVTTGSVLIKISNNGNAADTAYSLERSIDGTNWTLMEDYTVSAGTSDTYSYLVDELAAGTVYYFRVKAKNGDGIETAYSAASHVITLPVAPTGLTVTPQAISEDESGHSAVSMLLAWTAPTGSESFGIFRKAEGEETYTRIEAAYRDGTLYLDTGLTPNRHYSYYVIANNSSGASEESDTVGAYTLAAIPGISSEVAGSVINLTIEQNGCPDFGSAENPAGTAYFVQYSTDGGGAWQDLTGNWITYLMPQHTDVSAGSTYQYRVKAKNGDGIETEYSGSSSARTNVAPVITVTSPSANLFRSTNSGYTTFTLSGTVSDADGDSVRIYSTLDGVKKSTVVAATAAGVPWSLTWDTAVDDIAQSEYSSIGVSGDDGYKGYTTAYWPYTLTVDRTGPEMPAVTPDASGWTRAASVLVTVTPGADSASGASYTEYMLTGATEKAWASYTEPFAVTAAGETVITARTVDAVGNVGSEQTSTVKIDRSAPADQSLTVTAPGGDPLYTSTSIVNLAISAKDYGGAGNGADSTLPDLMQISNSEGFTSYTEVPYAKTYTGWALSGADGLKTVYIRFVDAVGNISEPVNANITLDTTAPMISISSPSAFNAKKGSAVTYVLTVDEESTLTGINESDPSNIALTTFGDFSADDIAAIENAVTVTDTDARHRTVIIHVPETISGSEGTIGITVLAQAATDAAGNKSAAAIGNASFVIDAVAPVNQNILFPDSMTVKGGSSVDLADCSENCAGGYDSDSVRFAAIDLYGDTYDGSDPANGTTITSTHGRSTVINAPTEEGTYYLYVIDAAGNVSGASSAILTVKNYGPTVSVAGPSDLYVNMGSSVSYTATYSADAVSISLSADDVALVTTGTANAYVSVTALPGEPLKKTITLSNLMGEGTVQVRISAGTALDAEGNPASASNISDPVTVDNTPAAAFDLTYASNNGASTSHAKKGDTLTLEFASNEDLQGATGTIAGQPVTFTAVDFSTTRWAAAFTVPADATLNAMDGQAVPFSFVMTDLTGNVSQAVTEASLAQGTGVTLDFTAPSLEITGDTDSLGRYIGGATVTFNEGTCVVTDALGKENELDSGAVVSDEGTYTVTVTDAAGNSVADTFTVSNGSIVLVRDLTALEIIYAAGDSAQSVTRDITLPLVSVSGTAVLWRIDSGTAVSLADIGSAAGSTYTAAVTRPDFAAGDETVVLTAELTKDGITDTKHFTLTVRALPDNSLGLAEVTDDAESALITYAYGDGQDSVTADIGLGDTGLLHGSVITWTSDNDAVISISQTASDGKYTGTVTKPLDADVPVTLTATAADPEDGSVFASFSFVLTVKKVELTGAEKALEDYELVYIVYGDGDSEAHVTQNLTFSGAVANGSTVTWRSGDVAHVSNTGAVTQPDYGLGNIDITITATIKNGNATLTKRFLVTVVAGGSLTPAQALACDFADLDIGYYGDDSEDSVTTHVTLPTLGDSGSVILWESSDESVIGTDGTVVRSTGENAEVTLTATLTNSTESTTKVFVLTVLATDESDILAQIQSDTDGLYIVYSGKDGEAFVSNGLTLRTLGAAGCTITWESSDDGVISPDGSVTRQAADRQTTLTATVSKYSDEIGYWVSRTKTFNLTVAKSGGMNLQTDLDDIEVIYSAGDSADSVTTAVYLAKEGVTGCQVTWATSNAGYITAAGKVTRPGPDGSDHTLTLTATVTNTATGETGTKVFTLTVKKMTDQDAVREAAKNLSVYDAFTFDSDNDIWESVTGGFLMLTSGSYDTTISWTSGNPDVITVGEIDETTGKLQASITRPADRDASVILTAAVTRGAATVTKTFLLIVKMEGVARTVTRQVETGIEFDLSAPADTAGLSAYRTVVDDGGTYTNIDTVIFDPDTVEGLVENISPSGDESERTLTLDMPLTTVDEAKTDEQAVEIPAASVEAMAQRNVRLVINSPFGAVEIPAATLSALSASGTDLYFRIMPVTEAEMQDALSAAAVLKLGSGSTIIGAPLSVETNYSGATYVTIPYNSAEITNYSRLRIFVLHSDKTQEALSGTTVYEGGTAYGMRFLVTRFSEFQLVQRPAGSSDSSSSKTSEDNTLTLYDLEKLFDSGESYTAKSDDGLTAEVGPGTIEPKEILDTFSKAASKDIDVTFTLGFQNSSDTAGIEKALKNAGLAMTGKSFTFEAMASCGGTVMNFTSLDGYAKLLVPLEEGQKITTAVRVGEDGSIIHIPTEVTVVGGKYYAEIHSLVTGTFALIWNPQEMDDVAAHWSKADVNDMASRLVVEGVGDNLYAPDREITRAEFAAILVRSLGLLRGVGSESFTDVAQGAWYTKYIETAASYGLILGYGDGRFAPDNTITREEAMTMLVRAMKLTGLDGEVTQEALSAILSTYADASDLSGYARTPAASCIKTGVILGMDKVTLSPKSPITRAQAAAAVRRLLRYSGMID